MSVWDDIDRETFEQNIAKLKGKRQQLSSALRPSNERNRSRPEGEVIPMATEQHLAEDFAFLAAWKGDPNCVSAASVSTERRKDGLCIAIAANTGVPSTVQTALSEIIRLLKRCALRHLSRDMCTRLCLETVAELHNERVAARLRFSKDGNTVIIADRLEERVTSLTKVTGSHNERRRLLIAALEKLRRAIQGFEGNRKNVECPDLLLKVLEAAYEVTVDGVSLRRRLESVQLSATTVKEILESREARVIEKLANYWRICHYLPECARSYHQRFAAMRLTFVPSYPAEKWPPGRGGYMHYVHAEIQLLIYHEMSKTIRKPRIIPASKQACFLCSAFIISHGEYVLTETHGDICAAWTIPNRRDYTGQQRDAIRRALSATSNLLADAVSIPATSAGRNGVLAAQSKINLTLDVLRMPSVSTLRSDNGSTERQRQLLPASPNVSSYLLSSAQDAQAANTRTGESSAAPIVAEQEHERSKAAHLSLSPIVETANISPDVEACLEAVVAVSKPSNQLVRTDSGKSFGSDITYSAPAATSEVSQISKIDTDAHISTSPSGASWTMSARSGYESPTLQSANAGISRASSIAHPVDHVYRRGEGQASWLEGYMQFFSSQLDESITCSISAAHGDERCNVMVDLDNFQDEDELTLARPADGKHFRVSMKLKGQHDAILCLTWPN